MILLTEKMRLLAKNANEWLIEMRGMEHINTQQINYMFLYKSKYFRYKLTNSLKALAFKNWTGVDNGSTNGKIQW